MYFLNILQDVKTHLVPTLKELGLKPNYGWLDGGMLVKFQSKDQQWESAVALYIDPPQTPNQKAASWDQCTIEVSRFGYAQVGDNGWKCIGFSPPQHVKPRRGEPQAVLKAIANRIKAAPMAPCGEDHHIVWNIPLQRAYFAMKQVLPERTLLNVERRSTSDSESEEGLSYVDASGAQMWLVVDEWSDTAKLYRDGELIDQRKAFDEDRVASMVEYAFDFGYAQER